MNNFKKAAVALSLATILTGCGAKGPGTAKMETKLRLKQLL